MILGLPWTSWLLLVFSVGLGLTLELRFFFRQRRRLRNESRE